MIWKVSLLYSSRAPYFWDEILWSSSWGPFINYIGWILTIFAPLPLRWQVYYISLCGIVDICLTPLFLACQRSLWTAPYSWQKIKASQPLTKIWKWTTVINHNEQHKIRLLFLHEKQVCFCITSNKYCLVHQILPN